MSGIKNERATLIIKRGYWSPEHGAGYHWCSSPSPQHYWPLKNWFFICSSQCKWHCVRFQIPFATVISGYKVEGNPAQTVQRVHLKEFLDLQQVFCFMQISFRETCSTKIKQPDRCSFLTCFYRLRWGSSPLSSFKAGKLPIVLVIYFLISDWVNKWTMIQINDTLEESSLCVCVSPLTSDASVTTPSRRHADELVKSLQAKECEVPGVCVYVCAHVCTLIAGLVCLDVPLLEFYLIALKHTLE